MPGFKIRKKGESSMDAFLKMIDDLQTPKHKTNHKYRRCFPPKNIFFIIIPHLIKINIANTMPESLNL